MLKSGRMSVYMLYCNSSTSSYGN